MPSHRWALLRADWASTPPAGGVGAAREQCRDPKEWAGLRVVPRLAIDFLAHRGLDNRPSTARRSQIHPPGFSRWRRRFFAPNPLNG